MYTTGCGVCTTDYFAEDLTGDTDPATYGLGKEHTFAQDGNDVGEARDFYFRAVVSPGENKCGEYLENMNIM